MKKEEEQELSVMASFKDKDKLLNLAAVSCSNEDLDDGGYWAVREGIEAGLRCSPNKDVWAIQSYEFGETSSKFDTGLFYFMINTSYEDVKKIVASLPDLITENEFNLSKDKIKKFFSPIKIEIENLTYEGKRGIRVHVNKLDKNFPNNIYGFPIFYTTF